MNHERFSAIQISEASVVNDAGTVLISQRALQERKKLGAFYTPEKLSNLLSDWAIRASTDKVLEPSFGGCGFLTSARNALARLGTPDAQSQIFGCDIDETAFQYLRSIFGADANLTGFILRDFLDCVEESSWPCGFDAILANPPYIPHHRIGRERVRELSSRVWPISEMSGRCSLWAYFIAHSLTMLNQGGRMAWVLPGAFLQADYARPIKKYLEVSFDRVAAIVVRDRLFLSEGTDEETVVLLADGYHNNAGGTKIQLGSAETLNELQTLIAQWDTSHWVGDTSGSSPASLGLSNDAHRYFTAISGNETVVDFGSLARVQIGIVTGANDFFVLNAEGIADAGLETTDCERVLSKFRAAPGMVLNLNDLDKYNATGGKTFLVNTSNPSADNRVGKYLATFGDERRKANSTFKKRAVWSATSDGRKPDGFFPVMHHTGPRLVLNDFGGTSTNTIHRVFFKTEDPEKRKLAAVSLLTSFSQISAELIGRRYGSGVLKHEPRDADKLQLLMPQVSTEELDSILSKIDRILRSGDSDAASVAADHFIYAAVGLKNPLAISETLQKSLGVIRDRRRPNRKST